MTLHNSQDGTFLINENGVYLYDPKTCTFKIVVIESDVTAQLGTGNTDPK